MSKVIKLTQGYETIVDDDVFEELNKFRWCFARAYKDYGYAMRTKDKKSIHLHRQIMNPSKKEVVDHINHNTLDNRKSNLRVCSVAENGRNMLKQKKRAEIHSKFKGVNWEKGTKKWRARVEKNGKKYCFGRFSNEKDAAEAYNVGAKVLFGEFANLNVVE